MSKKEIRLHDFVKVRRDESIAKMDDIQFAMLKDSFGNESHKGLLVTFDLSHSGRQINNRIYPPWGQRDGADSWTIPFGRPIIVDHTNSARNTIGRFVSVEWVSLEKEAIDHLGDMRAYINVKRALDSGEPEQIYKVYNKYGLFKDKRWPGVGKLVAKALITDEDAIERFLDGRYLTFSAGSRTNAYTCLACGSHWHDGDICDHRPGMTDEDGNIGIFMTGLFLGDEGSVVNSPADDFSQVRALEFQDFDVSFTDTNWAMLEPEETFVLTDSKVEVVSMRVELKDLMELEPETVVDKITDGTIKFPFEDIDGKTHLELKWLIAIHDTLHARYDHSVRGDYGESPDMVPTDVFKLHGRIHKASQEKGFRDSLINGDLDYFDDTGAPSKEYVVKRASAKDSEVTGQLNQLKDEIMDVIKTALDSKGENPKIVDEDKNEDSQSAETPDSEQSIQDSDGSDGKQQDQKEAKEKEEKKEQVLEPGLEDQVKTLLASDKTPEDLVSELRGLVSDADEGPDFVDDDSIDWFLLDTALAGTVGEDAKLSSKKRKELPDSAFCGPDRSFPVPDCAHVTAARRLIGRAKLSEDQKKKVLACVNRKEKSLGCESKDSQCDCGQYDELKSDYAQALKTVDELKEQLTAALEAHVTALDAQVSSTEDTARLDSLLTWFGNIKPVEKESKDSKNPIEHIKPVENPGVSSSQDSKPKKKLDSLGSFEQKILNNYKQIRDESGQDAADQWLYTKRNYLPRGLDLTEYIN